MWTMKLIFLEKVSNIYIDNIIYISRKSKLYLSQKANYIKK